VIPMSDVIERTESAPILRTFGCHAALMARLLRVRPSLLARLAYAPRRAIHAICAYLHLGTHTSQSDEEIALILDVTHPRDLLRLAIPDVPSRLYRALDRAGDRAKSLSFYKRLAALCRTSLVNALLEGDLHELSLLRAEKVLTLDPALVHLPNILRMSPSSVEGLSVLISFLKAHGVLSEHNLELPRDASLSAIVRRLLRALDNVTAPPVDFDLMPPFRLIRSVGELRRTGVALKNCIGQTERLSVHYWFALASGHALYLTRADARLLACVRRCGDDLWYIAEIAGPENEKVTELCRLEVSQALRAGGVHLLEDDPSCALSLLISHISN
jgi:hypothetical protein